MTRNVHALLCAGALLLSVSACSGTAHVSSGDGSVDGQAPVDAAAADAAVVDAATLDGALPDASMPDAGMDAATDPPLVFNIIIRQTVQACGGCGIWFDWQGAQANKPRLVIHYDHLGQSHTAEYQHGLGGMDNAHSIFLSQSNDGTKHSILVKQTPHRNGLFRADISDIPAAATIVSATLHLHIDTDEGLANSDNSSVLEVHACDKAWNWDTLSWTHYDTGLAWNQAGGDFGPSIRLIRAKEDLHDLGYSKANPNVPLDFTAHVQGLQAAR